MWYLLPCPPARLPACCIFIARLSALLVAAATWQMPHNRRNRSRESQIAIGCSLSRRCRQTMRLVSQSVSQSSCGFLPFSPSLPAPPATVTYSSSARLMNDLCCPLWLGLHLQTIKCKEECSKRVESERQRRAEREREGERGQAWGRAEQSIIACIVRPLSASGSSCNRLRLDG